MTITVYHAAAKIVGKWRFLQNAQFFLPEHVFLATKLT